MVGPPRGPSRPPMAPQTSAQPHQQFILKHVTTPPFTLLGKPAATGIVNYLSVPVIGNGNYLTVDSKKPETNGTVPMPVLSAVSRVNHVSPKPAADVSCSTSFVAAINSPHAHQYLIPKVEQYSKPSFPKSDAGSLTVTSAFRSPAPTRPTNHQRIKQESEDEGEEVRPRFDPGVPFKEQMVRIEHNYPQWLSSPSPKEDDKESTISSDEKVDHNEEGEETETAAEGEDSVTRCICNMEHDDGYMISCDQCYVWQHVACVLPEIPQANALPEMAYLCDLCQPRPLDRAKARTVQQQRRKQILRQRRVDTDDSNTDDERPPPKKAVARRRVEPIIRKPSKRDSTDGPVKPSKLNDTPLRSKLLKVAPKARRDSVKGSPAPTSPGVARKNKLKRKFDMKLNHQRRKSKGKDDEIKPEVDVDEEKRKPADVKPVASKMRCRLSYTGAGEKMVVSTGRVGVGDIVSELKGKYLPQGSNIKVDVLFRYRLPKDGTEVLLDGSARENPVRYANRVCHPNTQLKHAMVKASLRLYLVATEPLEKGQEITLPHGCVSDGSTTPESCGKNCTYNPSAPQPTTPLKPPRRVRLNTLSEESDREPDRDGPMSPLSPSNSDRKLTREEKKIEQAMKIFAAMEKETARKREKVPSYRRTPDSDKESPVDPGKMKRRRKRRKRRNSSRKGRLGTGPTLSGEESDLSSGEEEMSPQDKMDSRDEESDAAGLLLALGGHVRHNPPPPPRTPPPALNGPRENSENDSSPPAPMSSACLLVAAAVGPLAPGFKFPKTKKGMANEYQDKQLENSAADVVRARELDDGLSMGASKLANISNQMYLPGRDHFAGKKRWLRWQPNSGDLEAPLGSPPCTPDNGTPLKKRRLARESLTSEPSTPEPGQVSGFMDDDNFGDDSPSPKSPAGGVEVSNDLANRVREMQRGYLEAQGIETDPTKSPLYRTSPQMVPENLTVRSTSPPGIVTSSAAPVTPVPAPPSLPDDSPTPRPVSPFLVRPPSPKSPTDRRGRKRPTARVEPCTKIATRDELPSSDLKPEEPVNGEVDLKVPASTTTTINVALVEPCIKVEHTEPCENLASVEHSFKMREEPANVKQESSESFWFTHPSERNAVPDSTEVKREHVPSLLCTNADDKPANLWFSHSSEFGTNLPPCLGANMNLLAHEATKEIRINVQEVERERLSRSESWMDKKPFPIHERKPDASEATAEVKPEADAEDKTAPAKRKLSITEYLKRKSTKPKNENSISVKQEPVDNTEVTGRPPASPSPASDDDVSPLLIPTPTLSSLPFMDPTVKGSRFKVEPTELERQRENLNERLRREFGLAISDEEPPKKPQPVHLLASPPPSNGMPEKMDFSDSMPQSDIYPVGCSNPPNPFVTPYPALERHKFRK